MAEMKRKLFDDEDCRLSVTPARDATCWEGCSGCHKPLPSDELLIEYDDAEYWPVFCRRCVELMAAALGVGA